MVISQLEQSFPIDFLLLKEVNEVIEVVLLEEHGDIIHTGLGRDGDGCIVVFI